MKNNKNDQRFVVKRTNKGLGLFALQPIPARQRLLEYVGPIVDSTIPKYRRSKYLFGVSATEAIDGTSRENLARYLNHSCRPNMKAYLIGKRVWIYSRKSIKPGEELTLHYGKEYWNSYIKPIGCKCDKCLAAENRS